MSRVTASSLHDDKRAISTRLHRLYLNFAIAMVASMSLPSDAHFAPFRNHCMAEGANPLLAAL